MASTYSDLKIELIGTGEQVVSWGSTTNVNLGTALEDGHVAIQADRVSPGWQYENGEFFNPNPPEPIEMLAPQSLTDMILNNPDELAKLKAALGLI
jgi:hypothetical protein